MVGQWKQHPVTVELFRLLKERIEQRTQLWLNGNLMSDNATVVVANNALAQGYCNACADVLTLEELVRE